MRVISYKVIFSINIFNFFCMENLEFLELNAKELKEVNGGIAGIGIFIAGIIIGTLIAEMLDKNANSDFEEGRQAFRNSH